MMKKLGIIIQARMGSLRLPGKVILPFGDLTILTFLILRIKKFGIPILVATTNSDQDDQLCGFLDAEGIEYFRGPEDNVLRRFVLAARSKKFDYIVRICSDNPFLDLGFLELLLNKFTLFKEIDYLSFSFSNKPIILNHFGAFAEIVSLTALIKLDETSDDSKYKEHVTYGVYQNPQVFKVKLISIDAELEDVKGIRLTLDTFEDYKNLTEILSYSSKEENLNLENIGKIVKSNPKLLDSMKREISRNAK